MLAGAWITGILLYVRPDTIWGFLSGGSIAGILYILLKSEKSKTERVIIGCIAAAVIFSAFFMCRYVNHSYEMVQARIAWEDSIELQGVVYRKVIKPEKTIYYMKKTKALSLEEFPIGRVIASYETDEIPVGASVQMKGKPISFEPATGDGQFDQKEYYKREQILFQMFPENIQVVHSPKYSLGELLYQIQKRISVVYESELNDLDAGILETLVLGNKGVLDQDVRQQYQKAGIAHILAISGLHISVVGLFLYRNLRRRSVSYPVSVALSSAVVTLYALMSGFGVSAKRAVFMYYVLMGARLFGRTYDPITALAIAAILILVQNPYALFQSSFLFSFLAMCIVILVLPSVAQMEGKQFWKRILSGIIMQLYLAPLTAWTYFEIPGVAFLLNLIIIPLCSWLLGLGMVGGIVGCFAPYWSKWILVPCHGILLLYEKLVTLANQLPFGQIILGRPRMIGILLYYLVLGILAVLAYQKRANPFLEEQKQENGKPLKRILWGMLCFSIGFWLVTGSRPSPLFLAFLDVGQGDGICITDGRGRCVCMDGGSTSESQVGKYCIEPFLKYHRIRRVDAWVITHGDEDHCNGVLEAMEDGVKIQQIILAESMPRDAAWEELIQAAARHQIQVTYACAGSQLALHGGCLTCLYPEAQDHSEDANAMSQVWEYRTEDGMSVLFTGDIGAEQEDLLLQRQKLNPCLVLKVAHHGSKYSSQDVFLQKIQARYAIVSVGEKNVPTTKLIQLSA